MTRPKQPQFKIDQQESRAKIKGLQRIIFSGRLSLDLGINAFKRTGAKYFLASQFKENAWNSFNPNHIELKPSPGKYELQVKQPIATPPGLTNHQRHQYRSKARKATKELQNATKGN